MQSTISVFRASALVLSLAFGTAAFAQDYPTKSIRMITPNSAGSGTDINARRLAEKLSTSLGKTVYVENLPGAGGILGTQALVHAPKDGYTLAFVTTNHVVFPHLYKSVPFDAVKDVTPIAWLIDGPLVLVARPDFPANDVKQLKQLALGRRVTMGSGGNGTILHLVGVYMQQMGGFKMEHIPYKGSSPVIPDVIEGTVDVAFFAIQSVDQLIATGKLKALGVTSAQRSAALPNVPAISESLPGFEMNAWNALIGPAGMPPAVVKRLNEESIKAVNEPDFKAFLKSTGNVVRTMSPTETARAFADEYKRYGELVKSAGLSLE